MKKTICRGCEKPLSIPMTRVKRDVDCLECINKRRARFNLPPVAARAVGAKDA